MPLSENTIKEFQEIYKEKTGKELAFSEASEVAHNLVSFFKLLYDNDCRKTVSQTKNGVGDSF